MSGAATAPFLGKPFEDIVPGDRAELVRTISQEDLEAFARLSGDWNPLHVDAEYARRTEFRRPVAHGVLLASYVSTLVGMHLPGPGALWAEQRFRWIKPVFAGDRITVALKVTHKSTGSRALTVEVEAMNQHGVSVMTGDGIVTVVERREASSPATGGRVALVTGASRGIGAAIVRKLVAQGYQVAAGYRTQADSAQQVCADAGESEGRAVAVQLDVTDAESLRNAVARTAELFSEPVRILVNAAAIPVRPLHFEHLRWNDIQEMLDVHVRGAFEAMQVVLPDMVAAGGGAIVNLGSVYVEDVPPQQWAAVVTAKAALRALTRSAAAEYGPKGIRVNMVSPGMTTTDSVAAIPDRLKKVQAMQAPLRALATPEEIAEAVVFLCSPAARGITGVELPVCGGSRM